MAKSLYERLGGIYAIANVIDQFSDALINNPVVGRDSANSHLRKWHRDQLDRLPGLKFLRTLWVADITGGPYEFEATKPGSTDLGLEEAHRNLRITSEEFDEVASVLAQTLESAGVPAKEKKEVLDAFAAHKSEVIQGSTRPRVKK